jgi:acid phosphatase type 7
MRFHCLPLLAALLLAAPALPAATTILRGPYLQSATPTSLVVRWRTDTTEGSFVRYGLAADALTETTKAFGIGTEHIVQLSELLPGRRYFYSVMGSAENKDGDGKVLRVPVYAFTTPPLTGPASPTRVWVLGDPGTKGSGQLAVRDAFHTFNANRAVDLWLMLGDNAYPDGTDADYQKALFEVYPETLRTSPLWPALGNHDGHSANSITQSGTYYDIFTLPTRAQAGGVASGTEAYYSFDYANIHFVCLDSHDTLRTPDGAMAQWLKADLAATTRDWIIAFFHHPPYSKGTHDSDREGRLVDMRQNFLPILEAGGVDVVLTGHSHVYERSFFVDGHYGKSADFDPALHVKQPGNGRAEGDGVYRKPRGRAPHAGEVSVVSGSAGSAGSKTKPPALDHRAMCVSFNELGSVVLDIDGLRLDLTFVNERAEKRDWFAIEKK